MKNQVKIVINYGQLRKKMMNEPYNYTEREVVHTVWRLLCVAPEIQSAFVAWFKDGVQPSLSYAGVSFSDIRKYKGLNEFNAFLMMDSLKRNPQRAKFLLMGNVETLQTLQPDQLRSDIRDRVKAEMKQKEEQEATRNYDDRDEFIIKEGKSLVFKLNKKQD